MASLFYSGYAPIAPGTAGSAVAAVAYYLLCGSLGSVAWGLVLAVVTGLAVYVSGDMEKAWGKDPGRVVIDEAAGYLLTVAWLPHGPWLAAVGFLLFRVLDIVKPPPARLAERLPGGWGIVADDLIAGLYGNLMIRVGLYMLAAVSAT